MKNSSVAIVTGASQGIGRSTAIRLARDFSAVVLAARNGKALEEVAEAVKAAGAEPFPCALDLSQVEASEPVDTENGDGEAVALVSRKGNRTEVRSDRRIGRRLAICTSADRVHQHGANLKSVVP